MAPLLLWIPLLLNYSSFKIVEGEEAEVMRLGRQISSWEDLLGV